MVVFKLRSPVTAAALAAVVLILAGLALFRLDMVWTARPQTVVSGPWGTGPGEFGRGAGVDGRPKGPPALAVDNAGNVAVADSLNYRVQVFSRRGELLEVVLLPNGAAPSSTEEDRAAAYGLLEPCLAWSSGFRPYPVISAPARPWVEPVARTGNHSGLRLAYVTDIALTPGSWRVDRASGRVNPAVGPDIYLLAGWEGVVVATDITGTLKWSRDFAGAGSLFDATTPAPGPDGTPPSETSYLLDLHTLPGGGVLVTGYSLLPERLIYFVRSLAEVEGEPAELAAYELVRDGSTRIAEDLPIALEVESITVGADGLLYVVAAAPEPERSGGGSASGGGPVSGGGPLTGGGSVSGGGPATGGGSVSGVSRSSGGGSTSPFARDVWIYSLGGRLKGKLALDCETYTRYLRLIGVDKRGLVYTRLDGAGGTGSVAVFDGDGRPAVSIPFPEGVEVADAYLGPTGLLYLSVATNEGYQVVGYRVGGHRRLVWRWAGD